MLYTKLPRRLKLRIGHEATRNIKNVRGPNSTHNYPLVEPSRRDDENVAPDIASNELRNGPTLSKSPVMIPAFKTLEHISNVAHVW
jgi:hypothetical protein